MSTQKAPYGANKTMHKLILSSERGLFTTDDPDNHEFLNAGTSLEILLGDQWIAGTVWYDPDPIYAQLGPQYLGDRQEGPDGIAGYYFESADKQTRCGLCVGMTIRYSTSRST